MNNRDRANPSKADGRPLAVCLNDCEIDYGQGGRELAPVCFQLGCAFAEMRWGSPAGRPEPASFLAKLPAEVPSGRWQR